MSLSNLGGNDWLRALVRTRKGSACPAIALRDGGENSCFPVRGRQPRRGVGKPACPAVALAKAEGFREVRITSPKEYLII